MRQFYCFSLRYIGKIMWKMYEIRFRDGCGAEITVILLCHALAIMREMMWRREGYKCSEGGTYLYYFCQIHVHNR